MLGYKNFELEVAKLRVKNKIDSLEPVAFTGSNDPGVTEPYYRVEGKNIPLKPFGNIPKVGQSHKVAAMGKVRELVKRGLAWEVILNAYTPEFRLSHLPHTSFNIKPKGMD